MNTIQTESGTEVYLSEIHRLADEFTRDMSDEKAQQPQVFTAMLNYIYRSLFKPTAENMDIYERNRGTARQNSILNYNDLQTLDSIWNAYIDLTVEYNQIPTLLDYSVLTGVDKDTLTTWENGSVRSKTDGYMRTIKRWKSTCEAALARRAILHNSIGSIFALKCSHNWRETAPVTIGEQESNGASQTPEQIMMKYRNVERPTLPQMDED